MATPIKDQLTNNTIRTYYALDEAVVKAHREDRNEYAISTARNLLGNADLPLLIRARACVVLGCSEEPDFLDMAKEGVRIAELGPSRFTNPGETEHQLVEGCRQVLEEAQQAWDQMKKGMGKKEGTPERGLRRKEESLMSRPRSRTMTIVDWVVRLKSSFTIGIVPAYYPRAWDIAKNCPTTMRRRRSEVLDSKSEYTSDER